MPETKAPARPGQAGPDEPVGQECLRCYLGRMLIRHGCDNTKRWTIRWRDARARDDKRLLDELADRGGICCDCEVVMNVWEEPADAVTRAPGPCPGSGSGSGSGDPLDLCARWTGLSLRAPDDGCDGYDGYDDGDGADEDYDLM